MDPADAFLADVLTGLAARPRRIPPKHFYDAEGSRLFDAITRLDAYYPTRTERAILTAHAAEMVAAIGPDAALVEYGSGSSDKTRVLLDAFREAAPLAAYVPIDISAEHLAGAAERLRAEYPGLPVHPVAADYTQPFRVPELPAQTRRRVVFFPGSTVGNFTADETQAFFAQAADVAGPGGALLLGSDLRKDAAVLHAAYDDPEGVTAAFNRNVLARMNRELGADARLAAWAHEARVFDDRVEMHLVSCTAQTLTVGGHRFDFEPGESVHTETSTKYAPDELAGLAAGASFRRTHRWTDPRGWFAVELFVL